MADLDMHEIRKAQWDDRRAVGVNAAANGRAFCLALVAICIAVYLVTRDSVYVPLATVASLPIALSYIADALSIVALRGAIMALNVFIAAMVMIVLFTV